MTPPALRARRHTLGQQHWITRWSVRSREQAWAVALRPHHGRMDLLFVCTGNLCRSPLAERLLRSWAERDLGAAADRLRIAIAGTAAVAGPMDERSAQALRELGGDPAGASGRPVTPELSAGADLVLTMTREQRRAVLQVDPRGLRRVFTLAEASGLLGLADRTGLALLPPDERARELAARLNGARAYRPGGPDDDIRDPIGQPLEAHREVAARIAEELRPLADVLLAPARGPRLPRRPTPVGP